MRIGDLRISHYKSIRELRFKPKRVNVFIGGPNTGKSNILEALAFFSNDTATPPNMKTIFRFNEVRELFYDLDFSKPVEVFTDKIGCTIDFARNELGAILNRFHLDFWNTSQNKNSKGRAKISQSIINPDGQMHAFPSEVWQTYFRYYQYKRFEKYPTSFRSFLSPPFGDNLPTVIISNSEIKKLIGSMFKSFGYRLQIKPIENEIMFARESGDELYSYPLLALSETVRRVMFMTLAIESNKDSVLIFDEPESNTFPFYTKYIAERIALDKSNQYFMTTHNPTLLFNLIEKTPQKDLNVVLTTMKDFETKLQVLNPKELEIAESLQDDLFFNFKKIERK